MPHMQDPFFGKAVVFMCEHDKQGAMGLIVNKPFRDLELKEEFDQLYEDSDEILSAVSQVYFGGPVLVERGILLHGEMQIKLWMCFRMIFLFPLINKH